MMTLKELEEAISEELERLTDSRITVWLSCALDALKGVPAEHLVIAIQVPNGYVPRGYLSPAGAVQALKNLQEIQPRLPPILSGLVGGLSVSGVAAGGVEGAITTKGKQWMQQHAL
jgi:hypothetical protein